jgi:hypothetical protein
MKKSMLVMAMVIALAMSALAPAMADGNSARSEATPVALTADDVNIVQFGTFSYVAIDHNLGDQGCTYTYREAARLGGQTEDALDLGTFNTLYLGVSDGGNAISHKGQVSVYYTCDDGVKSIVAQFNGKGEVLSVNGVKVS